MKHKADDYQQVITMMHFIELLKSCIKLQRSRILVAQNSQNATFYFYLCSAI